MPLLNVDWEPALVFRDFGDLSLWCSSALQLPSVGCSLGFRSVFGAVVGAGVELVSAGAG